MSQQDVAKTMLGMKNWAVIGANDNTQKYGNIIYKRLKSYEYEVYPINPLKEIVEGDKCYKNLSELPSIPEVLCLVVCPEKGIEYLKEALDKGIKYIWLQPDTYDEQIIEFLDANGFEYIKACVMVALSYR